MLRRHIVLLIAIRLLDGDVKLGGPLGAFQEEQAMRRHLVSPSPFLSSSSSSHTCPTCNVVCPSSTWIENRPHLTPSIHLAWNPKHVIVQWVGIGNKQTNVSLAFFDRDMFPSKYARRVRPWSFSMHCRWRHWGRVMDLLPLQRHTCETSLVHALS